MALEISRKSFQKNAYRVTKQRELTALRVRVPAGEITGDLLSKVSEIANTFGNGKIHLTTRQGFEIKGIRIVDVPKVNLAVQSLIEGLDVNQPNGVGNGYPAAGTRNVPACIGNEVCPKAAFETAALAKRIEKEIYPNDFHLKVAVTGCPNDCLKVRQHDFGISGMAKPLYEADRCIACESCVKKCKGLSTGALSVENYKIVRDPEKCIGCGECALACPTSAWTRDSKKYFRLAIFGRTGKKNPRLGEDWLLWTDQESIIKIINNTYAYIAEYIDKKLP
ncbi:MAG: sulfite reductase subunit C, partial [Brevinema sp.]